MKIDFDIVDRCRGGLTIDFLPCHPDASWDQLSRSAPDNFSVTEDAFLFLERGLARVFPN